MSYELLVLGLMLLLIVGAVVDARLVLFFGLNALDHVVVFGGGAVAVDADAVKDFWVKLLVLLLFLHLFLRGYPTARKQVKVQVHLRADALLDWSGGYSRLVSSRNSG